MSPDLKLGINTCFAAKRWSEGDAWARVASESPGRSHLSAKSRPPGCVTFSGVACGLRFVGKRGSEFAPH